MIEVLLILGALALVAACGAFVAAEFSFVTVDRGTVDRAVEAGDRAATGVQTRAALAVDAAVRRPGRHHRHQPGRSASSPSRRSRAASTGRSSPLGIPEDAVPGIALGDRAGPRDRRRRWSSASSCPRTSRSPGRWRRPAPPRASSAGSRASAGPIIRCSTAPRTRILRRIGIEPQEELASARSPEELASLVRRSAERARCDRGTAALLQRSLAFGERTARRDHDAARADGDASPEDDPIAAVTEAARATGRSRFPVLGENGDDHRGIVHVKHAVAVPFERRSDVKVSRGDGEPVARARQPRARRRCSTSCAAAACSWRSSWTSSATSTGS